MPSTHILMWLLAKAEASWLWNKAPEFRDLQQNFNINLVMLPTALVSTVYMSLRWKRSPLYMPSLLHKKKKITRLKKGFSLILLVLVYVRMCVIISICTENWEGCCLAFFLYLSFLWRFLHLLSHMLKWTRMLLQECLTFLKAKNKWTMKNCRLENTTSYWLQFFGALNAVVILSAQK